jgi:hypothetical protein
MNDLHSSSLFCALTLSEAFCSLFFRARRDMTRICSSKYFVPLLSLQRAAHNTAIHYIDRHHLSPPL